MFINYSCPKNGKLTKWLYVPSCHHWCIQHRCIVGYVVNNTMGAELCSELYQQTVQTRGAPEIINTDQGV